MHNPASSVSARCLQLSPLHRPKLSVHRALHGYSRRWIPEASELDSSSMKKQRIHFYYSRLNITRRSLHSFEVVRGWGLRAISFSYLRYLRPLALAFNLPPKTATCFRYLNNITSSFTILRLKYQMQKSRSVAVNILLRESNGFQFFIVKIQNFLFEIYYSCL